ncbi:N-acetylmuramoyl-L-alanine amidase [Romeria aff. gracilis LEGE 07310]|uniref:N-acetylmuramoyl-L-alanine amidase n=1 Tax=Vasconcelosia minhoensis LEGE 07310 TaxID=915328 RepID=A0A8J7DQM8_9CYAN|nr:peptidoglycan-binding domain-containing protein [Romeria gracilis]MBE9076804.1 N-acetylmuramoyl-L-alanine amidase [Romeria aff. gracilis LEGE 07310]
MPFSLIWLPKVLQDAGLKVALVDGWEDRGKGDIGTVKGVVCHHTAGPRNGNMPSLQIVKNGHPNLSGPLSQLCLGRDGTYYVVAAGKANHAGSGVWQGITTGNTNFIGIEAENTGLNNDFPWPDIQMDAYRHGVAAILKKINKGTIMCCGHKEYAPGHKIDPLFDMNAFRSEVDAILQGTTPPLRRIPQMEDSTTARPTLRRGATGDLVKQIQRKVRVDIVDGIFGSRTEAAVREFQRKHSLVPDGIVGPKTWAALDDVAI